MYEKTKSGWMKHWDFILFDLVVLCLSITLSFYFSFPDIPMTEYKRVVSISVMTDMLVILMSDLFNNVLQRKALKEFFVCLIQASITRLVVLLVLRFTDEEIRLSILNAAAVYLTLSFPGRSFLKKYVKKKNRAAAEVSLYIAASSMHIHKIIRDIREHNNGKYQIRGLFLLDDVFIPEIEDIPVVCDMEHAADYLRNSWADALFIDSTDAEFPEDLKEQCLMMGITVHTRIPGSLDDFSGQFIQRVGSMTSITSSLHTMSVWEAGLKRAADILGGLIGCLGTGILFLFIAPLIYRESPGPIFFSQTRIGQNGKPFKMYKFRSMCPDAEEKRSGLESQNRVSDGMMFKLDFDPRIIGNKILPDGTRKTGIGDFIRRTSIDETPQFFNVLRGDMSLVGTRPPTVDEVKKYDFGHKSRLSTKPGITGMWQVSGRSEITDFEEVVRLDTDYIRNWSLRLDAKILLQTFKVVFLKVGSM